MLGLLLAAGGVAWLLDTAGVDVPWRAAPAAALIVIGVALLASLAGGTGRADPATVVLDVGAGEVAVDRVPA